MDTIRALKCCDCDSAVTIKFCLLTPTDQIVYLTTCPRCNGHKTLRFFEKLEHAVWLEASLHMPTVAFARRAA